MVVAVDKLSVALTAEYKFLSGLVQDPSIIVDADLQSSLFSITYDADVFSAVDSLKSEHKPVNDATITDWLNKREVIPPVEGWTRMLGNLRREKVDRDDSLHFASCGADRGYHAPCRGARFEDRRLECRGYLFH